MIWRQEDPEFSRRAAGKGLSRPEFTWENRGRLPISGISARLFTDTLDRNREASPVFPNCLDLLPYPVLATHRWVSHHRSHRGVRLYAQTGDPAIQSRCLDLIDEMEQYHFIGLADELRRLER
jgi:hypothetical protein